MTDSHLKSIAFIAANPGTPELERRLAGSIVLTVALQARAQVRALKKKAPPQ